MVSYRSNIVRYLVSNGPSSGAELPRETNSPSLDPYEKKAGVRRFNPTISTPTNRDGTKFRNTNTVFYLEKEHDPKEVIREWVKLNPGVVENVPVRAFLQAINNVGPKFANVSKEVTRDIYGEARWNDAWSGGGGGEEGEDSHETRNKLLDADPSEVFGDDEDE